MPNFYDRTTLMWEAACCSTFGKVLPMNYIHFDEETNKGEVGHQIGALDNVLTMPNGAAVRIFVVTYNYEGVKHEHGTIN